uniref:Glycosyl transferase family 25 domain-containing protein n=1 Tax=Strigamia maritima TaxID=126957 RepID=T1JHI5_STRMM
MTSFQLWTTVCVCVCIAFSKMEEMRVVCGDCKYTRIGTLNETFLKSKGIHMLPQYEDPYHKRPLTMGEIGCFLSHYKIWEEVVEEQYRAVIVFEDDIQFEPYFRKKVNRMMKEMQSLQLDWDLV